MNPTLQSMLSVTLAVLFWLVVLTLWKTKRYEKNTIGPVIMAWCLHVAIFWTVSATRRLLFGYVGPSVLMTYWSTITYLQAGLSILGMLILSRKHHPLP